MFFVILFAHTTRSTGKSYSLDFHSTNHSGPALSPARIDPDCRLFSLFRCTYLAANLEPRNGTKRLVMRYKSPARECERERGRERESKRPKRTVPVRTGTRIARWVQIPSLALLAYPCTRVALLSILCEHTKKKLELREHVTANTFQPARFSGFSLC